MYFQFTWNPTATPIYQSGNPEQKIFCFTFLLPYDRDLDPNKYKYHFQGTVSNNKIL